MSYPPSAYKTWTSGEILTAADLNNTVTTINSAMEPESIDDYSANNAEMQIATDPYPAGVESKATDIAGELARIRYLLAQITGETYWYIDPDSNIASIVGGSQTYTGTNNMSFADGSVSAPSISHSGDSNTGRYFGTDEINDVTAGAVAHKIDSAGRNTYPKQPCFLASAGVSNVTGDGTNYTVIFDNEQFDVASNYNPTTGIFTAPIAGKYLFRARVLLSGLLTTHTTQSLQLDVTPSVLHTVIFSSNPFTTNTLEVSGLVNMAANDTAKVILTISGGTKVVDINATSYFSGMLVA